jgi:hypothetical protein
MHLLEHPGLRFCVGDIVIPTRKNHPIFLRSEPDLWIANWETCPIWNGSSPAVIIKIKVDMNSIGEVMFKLMTPHGSGWTDWWNINRS